MSKRTQRVDLLGILNIHSVTKHHTNCRGTLRKKISGKILTMSKKVKGGTLVSPSTVGYAEKQEQRSWFSSLCPTVQFDTIIIRRVFVELFWAVRVD